jgi:hypothetical protein
MATALAARLHDKFGFRVVFQIGPTRLLRAVAILMLVLGCAIRLASIDPNAASKGQDTWNYLAAGERLNAGHSIYSLVAGDRPTIIWPPGFVALASPPLVAVLWRPLALLPDLPAMWAWWAASAAAMSATALWICFKGKWQALVAISFLSPTIAADVFSGNLNSFLAPAMALSWWSVQVGRPRVAGFLTALGAVLKVGPAALLLWLAVRREGRAIVAFAIGAAALAAISVLGAGLQQHFDFLSVARGSTDTAAWGGSVPGILSQLKAPQTVVELSIPAVWIVGAALIWALRHHPAGAFAVSVILVIWGTPVVHLGTAGLLLAALAPLSPPPAWLGEKTAAAVPQAI